MTVSAARGMRQVARLAAAALFALLAAFAAAAETPNFPGAVSYPTGIEPLGIVAADFNGDGRLDLATANRGGNSISILIGNGNGTFKANVDYAVGASPTALSLGDFNKDGFLDIAALNSQGSSMSILLNRGDGTFKDAVAYSIAPHPAIAIATGDFDGNNILDVAVVSSNQSVSMFYGNGDGTFAPARDFDANNAVDLGIRAIVAARIDNDDFTDLVTLNGTDRSVSILHSYGNTNFALLGSTPVFGSLPTFLAAGDFNGDGKTDLVAGAVAGGLSVLIGNGDGTFQPPVQYSVANSLTGLVTVDVDGDGALDLVITNADNFNSLGYLTIYVGNGNGTFRSPLTYPIAYLPAGLTVGDFDQSGHPDVAIAIASQSQVRVMLSNVVTPQTGVWWNPAEAGRGYMIEKKGDNLFMAAFLYASAGRSTWLGAGPVSMTGPNFSAPLLAYAGGQTLTGAWTPALPQASPGNVAITFTDATHGMLAWQGGTIPIQRFEFVANGLSAAHDPNEPQTGWWWNPVEGGRGFSVEVQAGNAYIATYMYDAQGNPVWYLSGPGKLTNNNYQGRWTAYSGGQSLTGPYKAPSATSDAGSLTVQFTSRTTALLTLPDGRQIPIQRFGF